MCVLLTLAAMVLLLTKRRSSSPGHGGVFWAVLLFPLLHFFTIVTFSDWNVWQWYVYGWPVSGAVAAMVVFPRQLTEKKVASRLSRALFALTVVFLLSYATAIAYSSNPRHDLTYQAGLDIGKFAKSHPGVYAMGDRAGAVGYFANVPIIQLEGLMMDKDYLNNVRAERDLQDVLKQYDARYYISTRATMDKNGCYAVREPAQAGSDSPSMRTRICKTPVAVIQHDSYVNDIFDMQ
jgi:hypothetical protein